MVRFRYYLSHSPGTPSPSTNELFSIEAESVPAAIEKLREALPQDGSAAWAHILVWSSEDGERGFESTRLR